MPILDTHSRGRIIPPLANRFGIKSCIPVAISLATLWVLLPPLIHSILGRWTATASNSLTKFSLNLSNTTRKL